MPGVEIRAMKLQGGSAGKIASGCTAPKIVHGSVEPLDNGAVDGESGASELTAAGTCDQTVLNECQNLELFTDLTWNPLLIAS